MSFAGRLETLDLSALLQTLSVGVASGRLTLTRLDRHADALGVHEHPVAVEDHQVEGLVPWGGRTLGVLGHQHPDHEPRDRESGDDHAAEREELARVDHADHERHDGPDEDGQGRDRVHTRVARTAGRVGALFLHRP